MAWYSIVLHGVVQFILRAGVLPRSASSHFREKEMKLEMQVDLLDEGAIRFLWSCKIGRNLDNKQSLSSSLESWEIPAIDRNLVNSCKKH